MGRIDTRKLGTIASWALVGAWAAWAAIRLFGLEWGPLIALIAFTPYVAATALIPIAVAVWCRRLAPAVAGVVVALVLAVLVLPRAFGGPTDAASPGGPELRVLAANVSFGKADAGDLVDRVAELDADVLAIEELTPDFVRKLEQAGIEELLPHSALAAEPRARGTGLYARAALTDRSIETLPGGFALVRARVDLGAASALELNAVHTVPPLTLSTAEWRADLEALPAPSAAQPLRIMLGDFNATVDHDEFRQLLDRGYEDAGETIGAGLTPTWPTNRRFPPLVTIDHVLADERIGIRDYSVEDLPGSDHRAVFAELLLPAPD